MSKIFSKKIEIRFRDIDSLGHVNNAVIITYYEECRKSFFIEKHKVTKNFEFNFILANIHCNYIRPIKLTSTPIVEMSVGRIGTKSFVFNYLIYDEKNHGILFSDGYSTQVFFDYKLGKSIVINNLSKVFLLEYFNSI